MQERRKVLQFDLNGAIDDARNALEHNSHDVAHGVEHHENVANNVDFIVKKEGLNGQINLDVLKVAAWWHDYDRHSDNYSVMRESLEERGARPEFIEKVIEVIEGHSDLDNKNLTPEQTVLILADKIEYCDLDRYKASLKGMKGVELYALQIYWKFRIKKVIKMMDQTAYKSARELFSKKFKDLYDYVKLEKPDDLHWFQGLV